MKVIEVSIEDYNKLELKPIFEELDVTYVVGGYNSLVKLRKENFFDELAMIHVPAFDNLLFFMAADNIMGTYKSYSLILFNNHNIIGHIKIKY
jgi:hypothetical protein